ncbi:glycosyltransferase family 4 protein (plasmid) [Catenovulum sp. SX2]|uniref:glycosyltransferase family 4 protein n=1 Tax=Catenovulum sp. SX2 TaxID=3398614 RepID=UPI003F84F6F7
MVTQIYHLVDSSNYAGIESSLVNHCRLLQQAGKQVSCIFWREYPENVLHDKLTQHNIPYQFMQASVQEFCDFLKQLPVGAVIHTHGYKAGILGKLFCAVYKVKCVSTYHAGEWGQGWVKLYNAVDCALAPLAAHNFAVSANIQNRLPGKSELFANFVMSQSSSEVSTQVLNSEIKACFIGRLSHEKGPDIFVQVAKNLQQLGFNQCQFDMYGAGAVHFAQEQLPQNCQIKGFCSNTEKLWAQYNVLIISSRAEGLPMVAIEAMLHGCMVICTPVGQLPHIIQSNQTGLLAKSTDAEALTDCLQLYMQLSETEKKTIVQNAYELASEIFSGKQQLKQLLKAYSK